MAVRAAVSACRFVACADHTETTNAPIATTSVNQSTNDIPHTSPPAPTSAAFFCHTPHDTPPMTRKARKAQPKGSAAGGNSKQAGQTNPNTPGRNADKLTHLEELFAVEYVIDWNGSAAVRRAGYKVSSDVAAGVQANRLLKKAKVLARIETAKKEVLERAGVRAEAILLELAKIGFSSQRHLLMSDEEGNVHMRPGSEIPDATWDAVKSITAIDNESESESESPNGGTKHSRSRQRTVTVVMHDKRAALVDLGKYAGIFGPERVQVSTPEGQPLQVENVNAIPEEQRAERVAALIASAAARKVHADG